MNDLFNEFRDVPVKAVPKPMTTITSKLVSTLAPEYSDSKETKSSVAASGKNAYYIEGEGAVEGENEKEHPHPAASGKYKVEKAYTSNSAGGAVTEGCIQHYNDRIVHIEDEISVDEITFLEDISNDDITKYIVMGDVLSRPKFKR